MLTTPEGADVPADAKVELAADAEGPAADAEGPTTPNGGDVVQILSVLCADSRFDAILSQECGRR